MESLSFCPLSEVSHCIILGILVLPESKEAVLEYIVERKRMDDLAGSIIDGRFNEQKVYISLSGHRNEGGYGAMVPFLVW